MCVTDSVPMEYPLQRERAARYLSQRPSKINHRHSSTPFASYFVGVMQDKGISNSVAGICTTPFIPPVTGLRDMYSIYIFFRLYIGSPSFRVKLNEIR